MGRRWRELLGIAAAPAPGQPRVSGSEAIERALERARAVRSALLVGSREQAMSNSVVNRSRDIVCGVLGAMPFTRTQTVGEKVNDLGAGWLRRPDPSHNRSWFVSWVTDDLFFYGAAYSRVTVRDADDHPLALEWMPYRQVMPASTTMLDVAAITGVRVAAPDEPVTWYRGDAGVQIPARDLVIFESPLTGVLTSGLVVLSTAARLDDSANRFAGAEIPAGWLQQTGGEELSAQELTDRAAKFAAARVDNAVAAINRWFEYHESSTNPNDLQLIESRSYQDVATARVCNMPAFIVNTAVPGDSMTYKTALTARLDLLDFGLAPFISCWQETLSSESVTPRGTAVTFDVEPFLRTTMLQSTAAAETAATPTKQGAPA